MSNKNFNNLEDDILFKRFNRGDYDAFNEIYTIYSPALILENVNKQEFLQRNLLLPIPRNELNTNGGLTNEDQNYGY